MPTRFLLGWEGCDWVGRGVAGLGGAWLDREGTWPFMGVCADFHAFFFFYSKL